MIRRWLKLTWLRWEMSCAWDRVTATGCEYSPYLEDYVAASERYWKARNAA